MRWRHVAAEVRRKSLLYVRVLPEVLYDDCKLFFFNFYNKCL